MKHRNDPKIQMRAVVKLSHEQPYRQIFITPQYPESKYHVLSVCSMVLI